MTRVILPGNGGFDDALDPDDCPDCEGTCDTPGCVHPGCGTCETCGGAGQVFP